jgi:aminoglycoside/choline kinase family phosphotransferase
MTSTSQSLTPPDTVASFLAERLGARAGRVCVQPLSGDASTRRYFRLVDEDGATQVLAQNPEPFEIESLPFLVVHGLLTRWGLPVPRVLDVDGQRGIVLQEDLGDVSLQRALESASDAEREGHYREALGQVARLQREAARAPRDAVCFRLAFDVEKLLFELDFFLTHFACGLRGARVGESERAGIREGFLRLCEEIASWPRALCHRDFHSRNLMLHGGALHWIDFQDARMGPASYDLASLLRDSYVSLPEGLVGELAEAFRREALDHESPDVFRRRLELVSVQRNLKALGTFGFMATARGKSHYLQYVEGTLASARRNMVRHSGLDGLRRALARHVEELE